MSSVDAPFPAPLHGFAPADHGDLRSSCMLTTCTPARGPRGGPVTAVPVDDDLVWVAPVPVIGVAAARAPSPIALLRLSLQLAQEAAAAHGEALEPALAEAELIDAAARLVAGYLEDLPDLPLVGEPFGGEEGTD
jgi:hypothetical protein